MDNNQDNQNSETPMLSKKDMREIKDFDYLMHEIAAETVKDFNTISRDFAGNESGLWSIEQNAIIDPISLKSLFYDEDWIFIVVDLCALKISAQKMKVYSKKQSPDGKKTIVEEVPNHPLNKLLEKPNPYQDYHSFMYSIVVDNIVGGNDIIWKGLVSQTLYLVPFETISLRLSSKNDEVIGYDKLAWHQNGVVGKIGFFPIDQVIHIKRPNPSCIYWGLSPLIPGRRAMLFNRFSSQYLNNYYLKGAAPGLVLEMANEVNMEKTNRLIRSFEQAYTGRKNQRRTMILPPGVTAKNPMHTLADQQLKDYILANKETILNLLHVPKHEVSMQTSGSLGSEEYATALKNFWEATLIPTQKMISGEFTRSLSNMLQPNEFFDFDNSNVKILQDNEVAKANLAEKLLLTHSINEIRQEMYQKDPKYGYDEIGRQIQQQNPFVNMSLNDNQSTKEIDICQDCDSQDESNIIHESLAYADSLIKAMGNWFDEHNAKIESSVAEPTTNISKFVIDMMANQAIDIIKILPELLPKKSSSAVRWKAPDDANKMADEDFNKAKKRIDDAINKYRNNYVKESKNQFAPVVETGYGIATDVPSKLPKDKIIALGSKTKEERNAMLEARSLRAFQYMSETTSLDVMKIIKDGVSSNLTIDKIANLIAENYGKDIDKTVWRATRIARTESLIASSIGQAAAMKNAAKIVPNLKKMWLSTNDLRTRGNPGGLYPYSKADHWHMHGQIRSVNEDFEDPKNGAKLAWPRDLKGGASDVINCRCTWVMLPADEMAKFSNQNEAQPNA